MLVFKMVHEQTVEMSKKNQKLSRSIHCFSIFPPLLGGHVALCWAIQCCGLHGLDMINLRSDGGSEVDLGCQTH